MDYWPLFLLFIFATGQRKTVNGLFVTNIEVPEIVDYRVRVKLSCSYNMSGHKLNSVKWYKDGEEFFRYSPMTPPTFSQFHVAGVTIVRDNYFCNEKTCSIEIKDLKLSSSGAYRCEVSGDAPAFKLTSRTANMTVAALPQHEPLINGVNRTYRVNDFIVANCSSDWSSPAATLTWYINDEKATSDMVQPMQETTMTTNDGFAVRLRSLELRFVFDKHRDMMYSRDILKLKCVADINDIGFLRREKETKSYIIRDDNLRNSKLITSRNSGLKFG
ncbi:unnamed protein product [Hermetia illucens]|uniref:Ig-like domain-containing protein n=1 Tax=Hermetia illucens TaxID=343691 RepID=A0A7R8YTN0_HERIL|nr:unnamed protein product [Hermetia illucens]